MGLCMGQFTESFPPVMDGVGNVAQNYAYWLNKKYCTCYAITPDYPGYEDKESFEVLRYNSVGVITRHPYRTGLPKLDARFMRRIRSIPFNLVHAHTPFSSGRLALSIARRRGIPIVASFHSKYYDDFLGSLKLEKAARFGLSRVIDFYNHVDSVWTVNNSTAETLREYGYKGSIEIVPNGIDFETAENRSFECSKVNKRLNIDEKELVFIYVGQMIWQKNTRTILETLADLKKKGIRFKMLMVGQGYALNELKNLSKEMNLTDYILFLGAVRDRDFLRSLYCRANLLLFPSLYDTSGIVVKEAASQGCPAVVIGGSNIAEGIKHNFNGFLSKNGYENLSACIVEAIKQPQLLLEVGENARKTLSVNWEIIVDQVYNRYIDLMEALNNGKSMSICKAVGIK